MNGRMENFWLQFLFLFFFFFFVITRKFFREHFFRDFHTREAPLDEISVVGRWAFWNREQAEKKKNFY